MTVEDIIKNLDSFVGDETTDRVSDEERLQAATEATSWLLEELGNEHMVDRIDVEYIPSVTWYKMGTLTPYLLTAGQLRFRDEETREEFTRTDAKDLATMTRNRYAYAIEQYNNDAYLGIVMPQLSQSTQKDLIAMSLKDGYGYTGVNALNIGKTKNSIRLDMDQTGQSSTGLNTDTEPIDLTNYEGVGTIVFEVEIPDVSDINSVSIKFGNNLSTDYYLGVVDTDVNGNPLSVGVNTISVKWKDLLQIGSPDVTSITSWEWLINHETTKPVIESIKFSDTRIAIPVPLTFKYIFYRVGKNQAGDELIEFTDTTDIPFFAERYPQYKFAVAHKAAARIFRSLRLPREAQQEDRQADSALGRYRKNFTSERDMSSPAFKVAGISFRRGIIRRR